MHKYYTGHPYPMMHFSPWYRCGPSRLLWFGIGAGAATLYMKRREYHCEQDLAKRGFCIRKGLSSPMAVPGHPPSGNREAASESETASDMCLFASNGGGRNANRPSSASLFGERGLPVLTDSEKIHAKRVAQQAADAVCISL